MERRKEGKKDGRKKERKKEKKERKRMSFIGVLEEECVYGGDTVF